MPLLRPLSFRHRPKLALGNTVCRPHRFATAMASLLGAALLLSACADGQYPSLAERPAERAAKAPRQSAAPVVAADVNAAAPVSAALAEQLASLLDTARKAHGSFLARRTEAERRVAAARDAAVPSDAWAAANEALAELDSSRTSLAVAQDRLERLYIDDRLAHAISDGNAQSADGRAPSRPVAMALAAARDEVLGMAGLEDAVLTDLKGRMPG